MEKITDHLPNGRPLVTRYQTAPSEPDPLINTNESFPEPADAWWRPSSYAVYLDAGKQLQLYGMPDDRIATLLEALYFAALDECAVLEEP